jgi:hypothetical protein
MNFRRILQFALLAATVCPSFSRILINEIHYDPPVKTELTEFIELHNSGSTAVDVSGWSFTSGVEYTIPPGTSIPPGGYLVVAENPGAFQAKFGKTALGPFIGLLANDGETITLRNAQGQVEDEVDYQLGFPWPTVGDLPGYSIELINPSFDNDLGGNWRRSLRGSAPVQTQVLVSRESTWNYVKGTAEPSSPINAWRSLTFNDSSWTPGAAPIGFDGELTMGTELSDMRYNYTSFYMRKKFQVSDPSAIGSLNVATLYDDGVQVWINGQRVVNAQMPDRDVAYNEVATGSAREGRNYDIYTVNSPASFLRAGENVIAVQAHNIHLENSSDAYADVELTALIGPPGAGPTPGARNAVYDTNAPPQMRQVDHSPKQPRSGDPVKITVKITDDDGVASARLLYQVVNPGNYIELNDATYATSWTPVTMVDNGTNGDAQPNDSIYTATLPGSLQTHRRLIRYRIEATDTGNRTIRGPYEDDPAPNFGYFVYDGVPGWQAEAQPGSGLQDFSAAEMGRLATYHLVAKRQSVEEATWLNKYGGDEYLWWGTLVYDGKVYDHVRYRARGGVWRYAMGKNMWKFDFNRGHDFEARDNYGSNYKTKWRKLNLGANIQQGNYWHRGEQGMFESIGFRLFNMVGVESPKSHWINYRIVDDAQEAPAGDQYDGDYWGLYLAIEQEDGRFLDEHDLPDGNLYKMEGGTGELNNQGRYAATDKSDLNAFLNTYRSGTQTVDWWRTNADLEKIYSYHAIVQGIHHYDICYGKNYFYFLNPNTGRWSIHSWDLDLTWADNMFDSGCDGRDDLRQRIVTIQPFGIEYKNRIREIRDLLFNTDQAWKLIDEYALVVRGSNPRPDILEADRSKWDYHPVMINGNIVNTSKAGHGLFYQFPLESANDPTRRGSFDATVLIMKDYVVKRAAHLDNLSNESNPIPATPSLTYAGPANYPVNSIQVNASGLGNAAAIQWRVGEIRTAAPSVRGIYEIETFWESPEFTSIISSFTFPSEAMRVGRTYRARVKVRDALGRWSRWSAPVEFTTTEPVNSASLQEHLKLSEIMYNPPAGSDFEYLEFYNTSEDVTLDLSGVTFANGIDFTFPPGSTLGPRQYALLVQDSTSNFSTFKQHYGLPADAKIFAPYSGSLNNDGERLELRTAAAGSQIFSFEYNDGPGWPKVGDGTGHSIEHVNTTGSLEYGGNWIGSANFGGSPLAPSTGRDDRVVINELNAHTDYTDPSRPEYDSNDWIEILHRGSAGGPTVHLHEYYLSDDASDLKKWRLPDVVLQPGQKMSFDEVTHFHNPITSGFGLNKAGESVFLSHFPTNGVPRVADVLRFSGQENGFSVGRYPDGANLIYTLNPTRDAANIAVAPSLVIREIMYHPQTAPGFPEQTWKEFVEIQNVSGATIQLWTASATYRISGGIDFTFPPNISIPANGMIVLTSFDPATAVQINQFKNFYNVANSNITVLGPFSGQLANASERITLEKPEAPDAAGEPLVWVTVDEVIYTDASGADGTSESLNRISNTVSGNDPANFTAAAPTPGFNGASLSPDRDNDGMPNEWEQLYGLNPDDPSDADIDSDNDGLTNVQEYRAGTNPKLASSRFELYVQQEGAAAELGFDAVSGKTYTVLFCDDLENGAWQKLRDISGSTGAVTVNDPSPLENGRFYRLVTPALP